MQKNAAKQSTTKQQQQQPHNSRIDISRKPDSFVYPFNCIKPNIIYMNQYSTGLFGLTSFDTLDAIRGVQYSHY